MAAMTACGHFEKKFLLIFSLKSILGNFRPKTILLYVFVKKELGNFCAINKELLTQASLNLKGIKMDLLTKMEYFSGILMLRGTTVAVAGDRLALV